MADCKLMKMVVIDARPSSTGNRLLATFDMLIAGVSLRGLVLVQLAAGGVAVRGSKGSTHRGHPIHIRIEDEALAKAVATRALEVFEGLTGRIVSA